MQKHPMNITLNNSFIYCGKMNALLNYEFDATLKFCMMTMFLFAMIHLYITHKSIIYQERKYELDMIFLAIYLLTFFVMMYILFFVKHEF